MNEHEMQSDAQVAALAAWDKQQRSRKRKAALVVVMMLVMGFAAAAIAGHA